MKRLSTVMFVMVVVGVGAFFGKSAIQTALEQREQIKQAEAESVRLEAQIEELSNEMNIRVSEEGVRREALCFNYYVEPGTEVYYTEVYVNDSQAVQNVSEC